MSPGSLTIEWGGESLVLLRERALWWARGETLLMADPHFGKAAAFRLAGIPVPETTHDDDLERLSRILTTTAARKLVILGDFFHGKTGRTERTLTALSAWRAARPDLEVILVLGNHDRRAGPVPAEWQFDSVSGPWDLGPFQCRHEPQGNADAFVLAGHVHPSVRLPERIGTGLRGPCFYMAERVAVLPAFGSFTGTQNVRACGHERIFLVGPEGVIEVPHTRSRKGQQTVDEARG